MLEKRQKQDYHFIITKSMHRALVGYAQEEEITVNRLIVSWVKVALGNVSLLYKTLGNQSTKYEIVGNNDNEDIHLWIESLLYERIKVIHGNINTFSLAQIVRYCIIMVLEFIRRYGSLEKALLALRIIDRALTNKKTYSSAQDYILEIRPSKNNKYLTRRVIVFYIFFLNLRL